MEAFAFPFRFRDGAAVTMDTSTDAYRAQKIAMAAQTYYGELPNHVAFGVRNPVFTGFDEFDSAGLLQTVANHFADISITRIQRSVRSDGSPMISVEFD